MRPLSRAEARCIAAASPFGVKLPETFFVPEGHSDGLWSTPRCTADYESGGVGCPFRECSNQMQWCAWCHATRSPRAAMLRATRSGSGVW